MNLENCPRCAEWTYEKLRSHRHCFYCNYSPDLEYDDSLYAVPPWALEALKDEKKPKRETAQLDELNLGEAS